MYVVFTVFTSPKSNATILKAYKKSRIKPVLSQEDYRGYIYRKITIEVDTTLPTLVFVHGAIGSIRDFSSYLSDGLLQEKANMIAYDRIGYNYRDINKAQESIAFERDMLEDVVKSIDSKKVILVGYSYGGPIVLATKKKFRKLLLLAPAVYSKVEPMPWMINLYKFIWTRWLVPKVWQQASREKLSHKEDLEKFQDFWNTTPNKVVSIHGTKDWVVPLANSKFLQQQFSKENFELITIEGAGHGLVWTQADYIKRQLIKHLD